MEIYRQKTFWLTYCLHTGCSYPEKRGKGHEIPEKNIQKVIFSGNPREHERKKLMFVRAEANNQINVDAYEQNVLRHVQCASIPLSDNHNKE